MLGASGLLSACAPKHVAPPPAPRPAQSLVALLPDAETGTTGRAVVTSPAGAADLSAERDAILAKTNQPPAPPTTLSKADVDRLFGEALAALPRPAQHFTLYFRFESEKLTDESRALVKEILAAVKARSTPEVEIVGHTDTLGATAANLELGMKRALMIRSILVEAGLSPSLIEVASHGEGNLLVRTPDETPEPRNRRVEISVR